MTHSIFSITIVTRIDSITLQHYDPFRTVTPSIKFCDAEYRIFTDMLSVVVLSGPQRQLYLLNHLKFLALLILSTMTFGRNHFDRQTFSRQLSRQVFVDQLSFGRMIFRPKDKAPQVMMSCYREHQLWGKAQYC